VKTQFGWHIVKLNDLRVLAMPTLEDVRTELVTNIQQTRLDTAVAALTQEANVVRFEVEVDPSIIRDVSVLAD
jgi:peptidyl-prolyl cis-trans isomerase C